MSTARIAALAVCTSALFTACNEPPSAPLPLGGIRLTVVSGDGQSALAGQELPQPLVVKVVGTNNKGIRGQIVNFRVTAGGGRMYAGSSLTDVNGQAQDYWTLGVAGPQQVEVVAVDPTTGAKQNFGSFSATALAPAALSISPSADNFGTWAVGTSSGTAVFTVTNAGNETSGAVSPSLGGANAADFAIVNSTCGAPLAGGATCTVTARFTPLAVGSRAATLSATASPGGTATATLSGTGIQPAALQLTPPTANFGSVNVNSATASQTFTLANTGGVAATAVVIALGGTNATDFVINTSTCTGITLNPGQSCTTSVSFLPRSVGAKQATLTGSAAGGISATSALSGTGILAAQLSINPTSFNFGSAVLGTSTAPQTFTVSNTGGQPTGTVVMSISGANSADFLGGVNACTGVSLNPGQSCIVSVSFVPQATGARSGSLVASASPGGSATATLSGTGALASAQLAISPTSNNFGTVVIGGTPATRQFVVSNTGGSPSGTLQASLSGTSAAEFAITNDNCSGNVLAAGANCTLTVAVDPTVQGTLTAQLTVIAIPGGNVSSSLSATAVLQSQLAVSPLSLSYGNQAVRVMSAPQRVTITNQGTATTSLGFSIQGPAIADYQIVGGTCGSSLAVGASCYMDISFNPSTIGLRTATFVVSAPGFTANIALSGTGI